MDFRMEDSIFCIAEEVRMCEKRAAMGMPINIMEEAMAVAFHRRESSVVRSELICCLPSCKEVLPSSRLVSSSRPSNLSANTSAS